MSFKCGQKLCTKELTLENIAGVVDGDIAVAAGQGEVVDTWAVEWMREGVVAAAAELLGLGQQSLVVDLDGRSAMDQVWSITLIFSCCFVSVHGSHSQKPFII